MRRAAIILSLAIPLPSLAYAQGNEVYTVDPGLDFPIFAPERAWCTALLPFDRLEMKIENGGYDRVPNHEWTLDRTGQLVFTDHAATDPGSAAPPQTVTTEVSCFAQAEIQALAKAMVEPSPREQDCAIIANHAIRGEIKLVIAGEQNSREFSLGCTDLANPGLNAGIRAIMHRVDVLIAAAKPSSSAEGN